MPPSRRTLVRILRVAALAAVALGLYLFVRGMDGASLLAALRSAAPLSLALAAVASFSTLFWKALCWRVMLGPHHPIPVIRLFRYTITAFASSLLVPARAGEALRLWLLKTRDGVPITVSGGVALSEKLVDGMAMLISVSPALLFFPGLPPVVGRTLALLVLGALAAVVLILLLRRRARSAGILGRLAAAMSAFSNLRVFAMALGVCLVSWAADLASVLLCLDAVGVHGGPEVGLLILLGVNIAILVPTTPGNLGSLEIGAAAALDLAGVPRAQAMAFAILYHAVQVLPLLAAGLFDLRLVLGAGQAADQMRAAEDADVQAADVTRAAVG